MPEKKVDKKEVAIDPPATKAPRKVAAKKAASVTKKVATKVAKKIASRPSIDAIARAAYLNYRRRVEQGLPGDSQDDWLKAEKEALE
jgi:hypothetical protein